MERFAERVLRASYVVRGFGAAFLLLLMALNGYWTLLFPFLVIVGVYVWWRRSHPLDFR